jgi:hypothetical protein
MRVLLGRDQRSEVRHNHSLGLMQGKSQIEVSYTNPHIE